MKRIVMTMAVAVLMGSVAVAQESEKKGKRHERKFDKTEMVKHRTDEVVKKYGLNEQQAAKLLELNTQYADKIGPGPRGGHRPGGRPGMGRPGHHGKDSLKARPVPPKTDGTTQASPQQSPRDGKGKRPELTEEQKAKFEAQRKEMAASTKAYDAEIQKIMTAEQYEKYKADQKQHQRGPRPPKKGEKKGEKSAN